MFAGETRCMTDKVDMIPRRYPRYQVTGSEKITVTIVNGDGDDVISSHAELVDISVGGAKFKAPEGLPVKAKVVVTIAVKHLEREISAPSKICWVRPVAGKGWLVGCAFESQIADSVLDDFAKGGVLERRQHRREAVSLTVRAKWELNSEESSAIILNYSPKGGFCLQSEIQGKPGERVLLLFDQDDGRQVSVRGKAKWQVECDEGYLIGCEFLHNQDSATFCGQLVPTAMGAAKKRSVWRWFRS